jgi:hypothetical protein
MLADILFADGAMPPGGDIDSDFFFAIRRHGMPAALRLPLIMFFADMFAAAIFS